MRKIYVIALESLLAVLSLGVLVGQASSVDDRQISPEQLAARAGHDWKAGIISDISKTTGQQQGILTGDMNTIDTWTYVIKGDEGTYTIQEEIMRGLITGHPPLTRTEGTQIPYYVDGARMLVGTGD